MASRMPRRRSIRELAGKLCSYIIIRVFGQFCTDEQAPKLLNVSQKPTSSIGTSNLRLLNLKFFNLEVRERGPMEWLPCGRCKYVAMRATEPKRFRCVACAQIGQVPADWPVRLSELYALSVRTFYKAVQCTAEAKPDVGLRATWPVQWSPKSVVETRT